MNCDDPRTPLLGADEIPRGRIHRLANRLCSADSWRRRLPITIWLPKYNLEFLLRDLIAGVTVGLTAIPQGIAYAIIAGLPPQVGLYSSIFPGIVYMLFGSCKDVTIGPTAILSALLAKYVAKSADFAYLASMLSGCLILALGVLQLGFLLDFISMPVISGFTTAAALQIGATQLKSLFKISGSSGDTFIDAMSNFFKHISTVQLWDTTLGLSSIAALLLLKRAKVTVTETSTARRRLASNVTLYVMRARNAIVVFAATFLAYVLFLYGRQPFALTGTIHGGLPHFGPPPFSTVVNNQTLNFQDMLSVFGPEAMVMPLVAILESIAIAKAFAGGAAVDGTQEMIAIGACNIVSSFAQCMPATGSFTRTALNHASGVVTSAGGLFKATLVFLAVTLLSKAFYFIPRASLAGVIMVAMMSLVEIAIVRNMWRNSKVELLVYIVTLVTGACVGLEYGILTGCAADAVRALATAARPTLHTLTHKVGNQDCITISLHGSLSYSSAQYIPRKLRAMVGNQHVVVLDGRYLRAVDIGVAENLVSVIKELESEHKFVWWNFSAEILRLFEDLHLEIKAVSGPSIDQFILDIAAGNDANALTRC